MKVNIEIIGVDEGTEAYIDSDLCYNLDCNPNDVFHALLDVLEDYQDEADKKKPTDDWALPSRDCSVDDYEECDACQ